MNDKIALWSGKFGDEYTERNEVTEEVLLNRTNMWRHILMSIQYQTGADKQLKSILEVGAGSGANLLALNTFRNPEHVDLLALDAVEPNAKAAENIKKALPKTEVYDLNALDLSSIKGNGYDMVFTSGVLIHIHPDNLIKVMRNIFRISKRFVVCIEYFSPECREIPYRGETGALWANDFGSLYLDNFSLRLVSCGFLGKRITGLDNLTYWVFEKVN